MANKAELLGALCEHFTFSDWHGKLRHIGREWCIIITDGYVQIIRRNASGTYLVGDSVKIRSGFVELYAGNFCTAQIALEDLIGE